ncbi:MAG: NAD(P)/FAD-dependent oxidoreductase, partial [Longimicrobiales bacterium]|nr:NAD(P)/FAD-dependent oxidoreductase [Longimicrobiales bacterium]
MLGAPVLVVGGGPAGSVAGLLLARAGRRVVLIDRHPHPRPKACGECANPATVEQIRALGLTSAVEGITPGRLSGWVIQSPSGRCYPAAFRGGVETWTVERSRFDAALLAEAARAGVEVREGTSFVGIEALGPAGGRARVRSTGGSATTIDFAALVGADGLHSRVRAELGLDARGALRKSAVSLHLTGCALDPSWGRLRLGRDETLGLAPLDPRGDRWTLTLVTRDPHPLPDSPSTALTRAARRIPELVGAAPLSPLLGSGAWDRPVDRPWRPGAVLIGDAAGYYDPVTGEGIGRALASARLAVDALLAGGSEAALVTYAARLRRSRAGGVRLQRVIEGALRHPLLLDALLPLLHRTRL